MGACAGPSEGSLPSSAPAPPPAQIAPAPRQPRGSSFSVAYLTTVAPMSSRSTAASGEPRAGARRAPSSERPSSTATPRRPRLSPQTIPAPAGARSQIAWSWTRRTTASWCLRTRAALWRFSRCDAGRLIVVGSGWLHPGVTRGALRPPAAWRAHFSAPVNSWPKPPPIPARRERAARPPQPRV